MPRIGQDLASRLTKRIAIEEEVQTPDGAGGFTSAWQEVATVWAEIRPWGIGRVDERFVSMQMEDRRYHRITIRYREGITPAMRVVFGMRVFNIISVVDPDAQQERLEIYAAEGVAL